MELHEELERQVNIIDEAEKYQKEKDKILADNEELHKQVKQIEYNYKLKSNNLDFRYNNRKEELEKEFKEKSFNLEYEYKNKYHKLEKENKHLHKVIDKFKETIRKFIKWICKKFALPSEDEIIRNFEKDTHTVLDAEKQIFKEDNERKLDIE